MTTANLTQPISVSDFQRMFGRIYNEANERLYSDADLLLRLFEEVGDLLELIRKDRRSEIISELANIYSWLNAVANRFDINLDESLWLKYPGVCSYCLRPENCKCGVEHPPDPAAKDVTLRRFQREHENRPRSLAEHQALHLRLYGWRNKEVVLPYVLAAHIGEEAGEISREFRHKNRKKMAEEMADMISWMFALAARLGEDLVQAIWHFYPYECRDCHQSKCNCRKKSP